MADSVRAALLTAFDAGFAFAEGKMHVGTPYHDYAMERRDREVDEIIKRPTGGIELFIVWALKPGQPQIVAICSTKETTERYRSYVDEHFGGMFHVEVVMLDHVFARKDIQSMLYRAANKRGAE